MLPEKDNEVLGFLESLTFTFPDESPWEIKEGQRVPKYIVAAITFQVIHSKVPGLDFARLDDKQIPSDTFYGINNNIWANEKSVGEVELIAPEVPETATGG